jgi:hypothetical protein
MKQGINGIGFGNELDVSEVLRRDTGGAPKWDTLGKECALAARGCARQRRIAPQGEVAVRMYARARGRDRERERPISAAVVSPAGPQGREAPAV